MKIKHTIMVGSLLISGATLLSSCDRDDDQDRDMSKHYMVTVKAVESDFATVKDNVSLYVFDDASKFTQLTQTTLDKATDLALEHGKSYTVVAVPHSADMSLPTFAKGTLLQDAQIVLDTSVFADNNNVATSPGDLFHGTILLVGNDPACGSTASKANKEIVNPTTDNQVLWTRRKVAALTIIARNVQAALGTTDTDFSYVVRQTSGAIDLSGALKGAKVVYHPALHFSTTNKDLIAPMFYTYASQAEDGFTLDLYKGNSLVKSYKTDGDENPFLLKEGKHTVVLIDFGSAESGALINVSFSIKDWGYDSIEESF